MYHLKILMFPILRSKLQSINPIGGIMCTPESTLLEVIRNIITITKNYDYNEISLFVWPWLSADGSYESPPIKRSMADVKYDYQLDYET